MGTDIERDAAGRETVRLEPLEESVGNLVDISPHEKARLGLAYIILAGVAGLVLLSWATLMWAPPCRQDLAKEFFDFTRSVGPPLVTLVLGYYFRDSQR